MIDHGEFADQMSDAMWEGIRQAVFSLLPMFWWVIALIVAIEVLKHFAFGKVLPGTGRRSRRLDVARNVQDILSMNWEQFEFFCRMLFENQGYKTRLTSKMNDEGIDLVATKDGITVVAQCKRFTEWAVGRPVVQQLYGSMIDAGADHAYLLTTSRFSQPAREFAYGKPITLVDKDDLTEWVRKYAPIHAQVPPAPAPSRQPSDEESSGSPAPEPSSSHYVCAMCGELTVLPFKPTKGKPVYCKQCYAKRWNRRS